MEQGLATRRGRARASNQATSDAGELIYGAGETLSGHIPEECPGNRVRARRR